jgi:hypothetical protein
LLHLLAFHHMFGADLRLYLPIKVFHPHHHQGMAKLNSSHFSIILDTDSLGMTDVARCTFSISLSKYCRFGIFTFDVLVCHGWKCCQGKYGEPFSRYRMSTKS